MEDMTEGAIGCLLTYFHLLELLLLLPSLVALVVLPTRCASIATTKPQLDVAPTAIASTSDSYQSQSPLLSPSLVSWVLLSCIGCQMSLVFFNV